MESIGEDDHTNRVGSKKMVSSDFVTEKDHDYISQYRLNNLTASTNPPKPMLSDVVVAEFRRSSAAMYLKTSFDQVEFTKYKVEDLVKKRYRSPETFSLPFVRRGINRGINTCKKRDIIGKLVPLMPQHRRSYWTDMPESSLSVDLINSDE